MDEAITQAPAGEQIAFDRTALNPTEAAKMAAWQQESGAEPTAEEPVEPAFPAAQGHEFDVGNLRDDGLPYTEADKAADSAIRGWMTDAGLPKGTGTFIAAEARKLVPQLQGMNEAQRDLFQAQERTKLERIWGDGYSENLNAARSLVQEIEAKRPGIVNFLERSGLGDSSVVIGLLASQGHTRARGF